MAGCGQQPQISAPQNEPPTGNFQTSTADSAAIPLWRNAVDPTGGNTGRPAGKISAEDALAIALDNAGVPEDDAYNIKNEKDSDNGIPLYDIEFETDYGDYDFEVAIADGRIVGGDYEVDEEWLDTLGGSPVTVEEAAVIVAGKVPGADAADVSVREESEDGRDRYEGELFFEDMKYEFEIDPQTGKIFDGMPICGTDRRHIKTAGRRHACLLPAASFC